MILGFTFKNHNIMQEEIKSGDVVRLKSDTTNKFTAGEFNSKNPTEIRCYHFDTSSSNIKISEWIPISALTKAD